MKSTFELRRVVLVSLTLVCLNLCGCTPEKPTPTPDKQEVSEQIKKMGDRINQSEQAGGKPTTPIDPEKIVDDAEKAQTDAPK